MGSVYHPLAALDLIGLGEQAMRAKQLYMLYVQLRAWNDEASRRARCGCTNLGSGE